MGFNHVIFENVLIQKLSDTIHASEHLTAAVEEKKPTEGASTWLTSMKNMISDAHTDLLHKPELARKKQEMLKGLRIRLQHIRDFHEIQYEKIEPLEAIAPQIYERMNMNLEINRIRAMEFYVKLLFTRINDVSYDQERGGGTSEKALVTMQGMINARKETIILEAITKGYHTDGTLAYCYETNRQTAEQMFTAKVHELMVQPNGQFEIMLQYDPQANLSNTNNQPPLSNTNNQPPKYDAFTASNLKFNYNS